MRFAFAILSFVVLTGCYVREPLGRPIPLGETMLVRYTIPTEVRFVVPGDTGRMVLVRQLQGRSQRVSGDTIFLLVTRGRDTEGMTERGSMAIVLIRAGMKIDTVRFSGQKTGVAALITGTILFGLWWLAWATVST
jgi:hypothetical protein